MAEAIPVKKIKYFGLEHAGNGRQHAGGLQLTIPKTELRVVLGSTWVSQRCVDERAREALLKTSRVMFRSNRKMLGVIAGFLK